VQYRVARQNANDRKALAGDIGGWAVADAIQSVGDIQEPYLNGSNAETRDTWLWNITESSSLLLEI
jgi:hypothetical protein